MGISRFLQFFVRNKVHKWTSEREKIYSWIEHELGLLPFAEVYKGAVLNFHQKTPGHINFICHACRDIMNSMAKTYKNIQEGTPTLNYKKCVQPIVEIWDHKWDPKISNPDVTVPEKIEVKYDICTAIQILVNEHLKASRRDEDKASLFFQAFFDYKSRDHIPKMHLKEWREAKRWFTAKTHLGDRAYESKDLIDLEKHFFYLEKMLLTAAIEIEKRLKEVNEILEDTNK
jgi:hypothetical protein